MHTPFFAATYSCAEVVCGDQVLKPEQVCEPIDLVPSTAHCTADL